MALCEEPTLHYAKWNIVLDNLHNFWTSLLIQVCYISWFTQIFHMFRLSSNVVMVISPKGMKILCGFKRIRNLEIQT